MINFADRDQLFTALSCWLQMPCVDADHQPDPSTSAPFPVPMVYSHEHWFDISLLPLSAQVGAEMDADACAIGRLSRILSQLRELISRVPQCYCSRERMGEFLEAFVQLIRCAEKPAQDYCRRLAQCSLMALLDRFEPIGQFLLLSHLFDMVFGREITLSEEVREPQVLGMLIDIYRQNCFSHSNVECRKVFQSQLGHFYGQLQEVVYDDPFIAINFYTALLLLISAQALHRVRPQLLKTIGQPVIEKVRNQFSDWMRLREQKQKSATDEQSEKKKPRKEGIEHSLEEMSKQREEELAKTVPAIFYFQLAESERNVAQALQFFAAD